MAGAGHNHQQIKYSYFHYNNSPVFINKTPSVCTSIHQDQSMMSSSTSPWYPITAISGDNDGSAVYDGTNLPPVPLTTMSKPPSSISLNTDGINSNQTLYENYGHFFVKKTFHKPTYCHHCVEMLWGLIGQGYYCEGRKKKQSRRISIYSFFSMQFYLSRSLSKTCHIAMLKHRTYTYKSKTFFINKIINFPF